MLPKWEIALIAVLAAAGVADGIWYSFHQFRDDRVINAQLDTITADYRQILVLMDGADAAAL